MSSYEPSNDTRRTRRNTRPKRKRNTKRSVGATAISASGARNIGLTRRDMERAYGRGETARRVEEERRGRLSGSDEARFGIRDVRSDEVHFGSRDARGARNARMADQGQEEPIAARPAVYTEDAPRTSLLDRVRSINLRMPSLSVNSIPLPLVIAVAIAIVAVVVAGPARTYYIAWRESGVLQAEYAALAEQNEELNHEIERLQTLEGIEDEARNRGYVYPNEEALVVEGLEPKQVADPTLIDKAVEEHEKSLPWYVGILDAIFGYEHS